VIQGQYLFPETQQCQLHAIFRQRYADMAPAPGMPTIALPESLECVGSTYSTLTLAPQQGQQPEPVPCITEYRLLVEYPPLESEITEKFPGTLKQYRQWEAELLARNRAAVRGSDKAKRDPKKDKNDDKKKEKKDKRSRSRRRKSSLNSVAEDLAEAAPEPTFLPDLRLTAFDHTVQVLRYRSEWSTARTTEELLNLALAARNGNTQEEMAREGVGSVINEEPCEEDAPPAGAADPGAEAVDASAAPEAAEVQGDAEAPPVDAEAAAADGTEVLPGDGEACGESAVGSTLSARLPTGRSRQASRRAADEEVASFAYFKSAEGHQFLEEYAHRQPDRIPTPRRSTVPSATWNAWNPRLVGEPEPEEEAMIRPADLVSFGEGDSEVSEAPVVATRSDAPSLGNRRLSRVPESAAQQPPPGPHPCKRASTWDIFGEPREKPVKPVVQASVAINNDYLQVEGATDRRVRTASIAHKKNSGKAPSVATVRRAGIHQAGYMPELTAKDFLSSPLSNPADQHWKVSSTMQGLGDSDKLVEVKPASCRFGPLRKGGLYRMAFYLRNLDVDVTRFNIAKVKSDFVRVDYQPGHLAPGMATKVVVEVAAKAAAKIEQLVEIKMKAHVVQIPVTARILDAEEFDRLDAESLALHGRRIGRHHERPEVNKPGPVERVEDEALCREVLGIAYVPPPLDFDDDNPTLIPTLM